jgi:hypothetical protein
MNNDPKQVKLEFKKEKINNYNENFEATMDNIYSSSILIHQVFARLGYQIKLQEQMLEELKKLNKGK